MTCNAQSQGSWEQAAVRKALVDLLKYRSHQSQRPAILILTESL